MPKVSVVITIYNSENYIEKCARSLFEQTLDDMEYVFVDDGTPDGAIKKLLSVLKEYPDRISQVKIVSLGKNCGPATARVEGLKNVTGEYVIHCDSDDYVDREFYGTMYETALSGNYDIIVSDYYEGPEDDMIVKPGLGFPDLFITSISGQGSLWNKLVKSELVKTSSVVPPSFDMGEDMTLVAQYSLICKSFFWIKKPFYHYVRRQSSFLGNRTPASLLDKQRQLEKNFSVVIDSTIRHDRYQEYRDSILHQCLYVKNLILPALPYTDSYVQWKNCYRKINSKVLFSRQFTVREKVNFIITFCGLYPLYYKIKNNV